MSEKPAPEQSKSLEEWRLVPIPDPVFKAWEKANLIHPQAGYGIGSAIGATLFKGSFDVKEIASAYPTRAQFDSIGDKMRAAHIAKGIPYEHITSSVLGGLWTRARNYVIGFAYNYTNAALTPEKSPRLLGKRTTAQVRQLAKNLRETPKLRQELADIFALIQEALQTETVMALEKKRSGLLDYRTHGPAIQRMPLWQTKKVKARLDIQDEAVQLQHQVTRELFAYVAAHAKEKNLSVDTGELFFLLEHTDI